MSKAIQPLKKQQSIKKRTKQFVRFHSERFKRLSSSWRLSRGIDNRQVRFQGR